MFLFVIVLFVFCCECGTLRKRIELTLAEKHYLLDEHNRLRRLAKPSGSNIQEMVWDYELADFALAQSMKCLFERSELAERKTKSFSQIGENFFVTDASEIPNIQISFRALKRWYDELVDYDYLPNICRTGRICVHYKQLVWATSHSVGCGITSCYSVDVPGGHYDTAYLLFCSYGSEGNIVSGLPYQTGIPCSTCLPRDFKCVKELCKNETRISRFSGHPEQKAPLFTILCLCLFAVIIKIQLSETN